MKEAGGPDEQGGKQVVVFDVDGTIVAGQTQAMLVRHLASVGQLSLGTATAVGWWIVRYRLGLAVAHEPIRLRVLGELAGLGRSEVERLADDLVNRQVRHAVRAKALEAIARHRQDGATIVLISAAVQPVVSSLARWLGVDAALGTPVEYLDECLTGRLAGPVTQGEAKVAALDTWASEQFASWSLVAAYGDDSSDLAILSAADEAFAVCPSRGLMAEARSRGWRCLDWDAVSG